MTVPGIDVAKYQPTSPDPAAIVPNIQFYFAKATQGTTPDPTYIAHVAHARDHHIPVVGAYHFGVNAPALMQLNAFLGYAGHVQAFALDVEGANRMTDAQARQFIAGLKSEGKVAILYHSESGFPNYGQDLNWVANYSRAPRIPWDFWQYGPAAANVDGDKYKGTTTQMMQALKLPVSTTQYMAYISTFTPLYNQFGNRVGYVHGGGTRMIVSALVKLNQYWYYKILSGEFTGKYLHAGGKTFVVNKVPA